MWEKTGKELEKAMVSHQMVMQVRPHGRRKGGGFQPGWKSRFSKASTRGIHVSQELSQLHIPAWLVHWWGIPVHGRCGYSTNEVDWFQRVAVGTLGQLCPIVGSRFSWLPQALEDSLVLPWSWKIETKFIQQELTSAVPFGQPSQKKALHMIFLSVHPGSALVVI
jgi:hypothetical protein